MGTLIEEFDFELPPARIALEPAVPRDSSRLLLCGATGKLGAHQGQWRFSHLLFHQLSLCLGSGDFLVTNNAKVLPVRLLGHRPQGGAVEALLLRKGSGENEWVAIMHLSARIRPGIEIVFEPGLVATVLSTHEERASSEGEVRLKFGGLALERGVAFETWLERHGHVPLPPYIERADLERDKKNYQTVYAAKSGSAAAPTAGLHFTAGLLSQLAENGVLCSAVTLHVGLGTFRPMKAVTVEEHVMHEESFEISSEFLVAFRRARAEKRRIVAVGTTVVRTLESWAAICADRGVEPGSEESSGSYTTRAYIKPGYKFALVDDLITNFHLPRSSLLVLVAGAMGLGEVRKAYAQAIEHEYRFFSYGDAMFIRGA